eukprot:SAG31_NODE_2190_length_6229_cov_11.374388_6_plen_148_part_00
MQEAWQISATLLGHDAAEVCNQFHAHPHSIGPICYISVQVQFYGANVLHQKCKGEVQQLPGRARVALLQQLLTSVRSNCPTHMYTLLSDTSTVVVRRYRYASKIQSGKKSVLRLLRLQYLRQKLVASQVSLVVPVRNREICFVCRHL